MKTVTPISRAGKGAVLINNVMESVMVKKPGIVPSLWPGRLRALKSKDMAALFIGHIFFYLQPQLTKFLFSNHRLGIQPHQNIPLTRKAWMSGARMPAKKRTATIPELTGLTLGSGITIEAFMARAVGSA